MRRFASKRSDVPLYLVGVTLFLLGAVHVALDDDPLYSELAEASILFAFGAATLVVGYRLRRRDATFDETLRVVVAVLAGGVLVGALAAMYVATRLVTGEPTTEFWFVLFIGWSVGAAAGAWTGFYFVRLESALADQRDMTKRLTVLQRVLRHNLRNEMSVIGGASRHLLARADDPDVVDALGTIDRHVRAVSKLSRQSATLTRIWRTEGDATVDLGARLREAIERFRDDYPDVRLEADVPEEVRVRAHPHVGLAIDEALENAVEHNESVEVSLSVRERDAGAVTVEVADTGSGIPESELRPLWATGEGPLSHTSGLGLWMIYWLVEASDGELDVESDSGGTTLSMTLRRA